jgi:hypothetical protein
LNTKVHYRTHNCPPPVSNLSQPNPIHTPTSHFLKIYPNIVLSSTTGSPHWSLSLSFPHQNPIHASLLPHPRYMLRPSHSSPYAQTSCENNVKLTATCFGVNTPSAGSLRLCYELLKWQNVGKYGRISNYVMSNIKYNKKYNIFVTMLYFYYTVCSESRCALKKKGVGSDVHERLYRTTVSKNWNKQSHTLPVLHFNRCLTTE